MPKIRHSLIVGKNGTTIRRISANNNVRIYVPDKRSEPQNNAVQVDNSPTRLHLRGIALAPHIACELW